MHEGPPVVQVTRVAAHSRPRKFSLSFDAQEMHRSSTTFAHYVLRCVAVVGCLGAAAITSAQSIAAHAGLFRIILQDGTSIASYGEYARVGDRVVFSMPLGEWSAVAPALQLVSLPADRVDWATTEEYTASARAAHYAATRGEEDFAKLSDEVARALNAFMGTADPSSQLTQIETLRERLGKWPEAHFGYRAEEVQSILTLVDEVIADLRARTGAEKFDLSLVAGTFNPPPAPLLPPPTLKESIEQALKVAGFAESSDERVAILASVDRVLESRPPTLASDWALTTRASVKRSLTQEIAGDRLYARLSTALLADARSHAARANVRGVEAVMKKLSRRDAAMGQRRPHVVETLRTMLNNQLDAARRLRLARDQWSLKVASFRAYERSIHDTLLLFEKSRPLFEDIRALAGPDTDSLMLLHRRLSTSALLFRRVKAPDDLQPVHALFVSVSQLAENAVKLRQAAIVSGELTRAWDASAAAAGAMMLFDRARSDFERALKPPQLP